MYCSDENTEHKVYLETFRKSKKIKKKPEINREREGKIKNEIKSDLINHLPQFELGSLVEPNLQGQRLVLK